MRGPRPRRLGDLVRRGVLEQVAAGAGLERAEDPRAVRERRQHEHGRGGMLGRDAAGRLDAVDARHVEIHQDDVRRTAAAVGDRLLAVGRDAGELDVRERLDQPAEAVADDAVVVGDQHADHGRVSCAGSIAPHLARSAGAGVHTGAVACPARPGYGVRQPLRRPPMSDIAKRPNRTPRRVREKRALQLITVGGIAATIAVVGFLLALLTSFPGGIVLLAAIVAVVCGVLFKRMTSP